ncbi:MAG: tetratricopeptide repeat protein [Candidatus Azobacteroides pseudotrichonymphae]|jgi:tetratricopeptide (TPR) repeat protein|nr:tetratricopeptide repeat protein [Bacteroidales bacterium OttesenSCG-928-I14]GMO33299.1 MAG: tetratricopeptide repeat protein [Candidatus Azobacteroides pseudotrichonymphae]
MQEVQNCFDNIIQSIEQYKLKPAFDLLEELISRVQDWQLQEQLNSLKNTYKSMLYYLAKNIKDCEREKIHQTLLRSLYQIADIALWQIKSANDNSLFYEQRRTYYFSVSETSEELINALKNISENNLLLNPYKDEKEKVLEKENLNCKIFRKVWLSNHWTIEEKSRWTKIIYQSYEKTISCLIVTALTLNLLETFDEKKAILLLEAAQNEYNGISERALVGIVLFLRKYNYRLHLYTEITERLNNLAENPKFIRKIRHTLLQFISSKETEKITRKITDELIPEIIQKVGTKVGNKLRISSSLNENEIEDKNPEWHNLIETSNIGEKLQEISEWQIEGADVMHSSFIHLKNYPFFKEISNWFIPFTTPSEAIDNQKLMRLVNILKTSTFLCNSDKYSFYLSVSQMPENARKIMIKQFASETTNTMREDSFNISQTINHFTKQYVQDLYRFYKLYPQKQNFEDIFEIQPEFYKVPIIYQLIGNEQNLSAIGEYYFNKNFFEEAADIYDKLLQINPNNDVLYQKKGYCLQMMGQLHESLNTYQKAELLNANHSWTIKKLAYLYRILKNPKEALYFYKKAQQLNPENLSIQLNIGHCYLEIGEFEQALKYYFKVEYLTENKERIWRYIAWCSLLTNRYQQAINFFNKIIEKTPTMTDYLNAGHAQLAIENIEEAIRSYKLAIEKGNCSYEEFARIFSQDVPQLIKVGIKEKNIYLIIDTCYLL